MELSWAISFFVPDYHRSSLLNLKSNTSDPNLITSGIAATTGLSPH